MTLSKNYDEDDDKIRAEDLGFYFNNNIKTVGNISNSFSKDNDEVVFVAGMVKPSGKTNSRVCSNCGTSTTSTWRNLGDQIVCNACKCFYRKHGKNRPIHMRKDAVITRHRKAYKLTVPNESIFHLNNDYAQLINEPDSKVIAEAVCMMLSYLQNL